jgi:MYXO-CTERM domain-containing protein
MNKVAGALLLLIGMSSFAFGCPVQAPEIDAATGVAALALLAGGLLVIRSRRKRQK